MKNSKLKASQFLIKRNKSNQISNLADNFIIQINEITAIDNNKFINLSKDSLEMFIINKLR